MKISATTLGETGGDMFAQTIKLGYFLTTIALILLFLISLTAQCAPLATGQSSTGR